MFGYLEEEERVALEPLLGTPLYMHLCDECERLRGTYTDITATTIKPTGKARKNPSLPYAHVTDRLDDISKGNIIPDDGENTSSSGSSSTSSSSGSSSASSSSDGSDGGETDVTATDMQTIRLLRICQQIEFYKMLSHKAGLLTVSFNEGGGMNMVSADGYEPADEKRMERVVKDAYMSAGRAVDSLLLFLEADAKGERIFTDLWSEADAFYLHRDLLFQTARVLNEYLDIKGDRMAYVALVRDIRFCQNTYLKPRIGARLLKAVTTYANGIENSESSVSSSSGSSSGSSSASSSSSSTGKTTQSPDTDTLAELLSLLRTALAFYVEARRTDLAPVKEKMARRDSMTDAQQAMAMACQFVKDNLGALGDAAVGSPIYASAKEEETKKAAEAKNAELARQQHFKARREQNRRKLFTGFPPTHRIPELKQ